MAQLAKETEIRWVKPGSKVRVFSLGRDVVMLATDLFILFVETSRPDKKEILYKAGNEVLGDGIDALCTHPSLSCFGFSEKCRNPRILILTYPSLEIIKTIENNVTSSNYIQLCFSEMQFIVALTGIPDFKIVIWNWRTTEKLVVQETNLRGVNQIMRISSNTPMQILQSTGVDKQLILWSMNACYKKTLLKPATILLPETSVPPFVFTFGVDGDIYFVDFEGSLFSINIETMICTRQYCYPGFTTQDFNPSVACYKGGIVFTTPNEVIFLKRKSPEGWSKVWTVTAKIPFKKVLSSPSKELLFGVNIMNEVLIFKGDSQVECVSVKYYGADFDFVCFLYPLGDYFVTYGNATKTFYVWETFTGKKVSHLFWSRDKITGLRSNPKLPYLIATTVKGSVYLMSAYDTTGPPVELDSLQLTENNLDTIRFRGQSNQFCVANMDIGEFFLIKVPARMEVIAYVKLDLKIAEYAILDKPISEAILVVVPVSQFCCRSGQIFLLYALNEKHKNFTLVKDIGISLVINKFYPSPTTQRNIFCIPHRSRKIVQFDLQTGKVKDIFVSGHQMKFMLLRCEDNYLFTYGPDGLVIVKTTNTKTCTTLFSSHHRLAKGITALAINSFSGMTLVLGENGDLVCVFMKKIGSSERKPELESLKTNPIFKPIFSLPSTPPRHSRSHRESLGSFLTINWLMMREKELISQEEQESKKEKHNILDELNNIKEELRVILNENLENDPERQLPIQAFDLDKASRRKKMEDARAEREKEKQLRLANMKCLNRVTDIIKSNCWDSVEVKGREILAILAPISVQSYPLFAESQSQDTQKIWLDETMKIVQLFKSGDFFDPWTPRTEKEFEKYINTRFKEVSLNFMQTIRSKFDEQPEEDKGEEDVVEESYKLVWSGTSSHNFIEVDPNHYTQFELKTFMQSHQEIQLIEADIKKLMQWFNKEFKETFELKEREMEFVCERNDRLRHIIKELTYFNFSPNICKTQIYDPVWAPEENPETIMTVEDDEVKAPKYISDSEMALIQKEEKEKERIRQLMMVDDFREKALMVMMDGVLEKLWEDEIKKEPPKPKCLVDNKDPSLWTEEELKAVKTYEEATKFLNTERDRYRKILDSRWTMITTAVKDSVTKFDEKVVKLHILKLKVEAAIGQEILKALRIRQNCFENLELQRKKETIKLNLLKSEEKMEAMSIELNKLLEMLNDCKGAYESLQNKDKNLDKNFRKEFPEYSPIICEQLYKLSKKRPKLLQKAAAYSSVLTDLGKCVVLGTKPEYLPSECIQYLKDIDALDPYSNAPATVSQQGWELACKLRRIKIETELKIRACAIDLADAEATVAAYQKELKAKKEEQTRLQNDLLAIWAEKANRSVNFPIQLVLKKGLVEIPLTGHLSDFEESVLVTKETIKHVNVAIQKMGALKIKAMEKAANFRKGIIYKEWEHKKLRMEIEDLKGQLETIEKLQVLKELQAILVARARGFSDEKGFLYMENELAKVKQRYEKAQTEIYEEIDKYDEKIRELNAKNEKLDLKIFDVNVQVNEMNLSRDMDFDKKYNEENEIRMKKIREKGRLVRKIQDQHNEILVLQTELELLRLKTYPTIKYKIS